MGKGAGGAGAEAVSHFRDALVIYEGRARRFSAAEGMSVEKLVAAIKWHEQYMRWHDGDKSYHVLEEEG